MNIQKYINKNRKAIDAHTQSQIKNDAERELWILNDEYLYNCCRRDTAPWGIKRIISFYPVKAKMP